MLFPELYGKRSVSINLNLEAKAWMSLHSDRTSNPLLDPEACQAFVTACHRKYGVDFSYGGWLEDRSTLWQGSYLDQDQKYIHLGVDFNVPTGTRVTLDRAATVIRIDNDYPDKHGWGTRIIVQEPQADVVVLFAHLDQALNITVGDQLTAGSIIAKVGEPPFNGDWFPHLHTQIIKTFHYTELLKNDLRDLDGYGRAVDLEILKKQFSDPMRSLKLE
jgi:murein DD-endopeptidase MepM/ murein hydrolase activator NlpD